jgi:nucleoside-diphosphate-sugar epimerase
MSKEKKQKKVLGRGLSALLNDSDSENISFKHKVNIIYHFAAYAAEGLSPFIRKFNYNNNLLCSTHLVNCAIKYNVQRFVFTSSMATYGFGDGNLPSPQTQSRHTTSKNKSLNIIFDCTIYQMC